MAKQPTPKYQPSATIRKGSIKNLGHGMSVTTWDGPPKKVGLKPISEKEFFSDGAPKTSQRLTPIGKKGLYSRSQMIKKSK